ncbi:DUF2332 domain-containing protein [Glycomyces paridis]|uniref:DUF2332 domain-containing protein n=1 Tax=Glycomyces paridis TaxID=2126555 RepID=A0A4S8PU80_9ACTN|nr:DUF2332 domain-containing protein [Glycomyces paridis]THV31919.1 DUF2332 domain-containing protein [Glycomyces paridis]
MSHNDSFGPTATASQSAEVARLYARFAAVEANGVSPIYEALAAGVSEDGTMCDRIAELPPAKRQPNLVFAASRHLGAPVRDYGRWRAWLSEQWGQMLPIILERATQTNEAARCATLLPALAAIDGPIALLEVGASAGLCLYPDRYSYRYRTASGIASLDPGDGPSKVVLECELRQGEAPTRLPQVVWRGGIDRNPLDATDPDARAWLESLVWPEHHDRRERITQAAAILAEQPPRLVAADLNEALPKVAAAAPPDAHLVVFHSAVLAYLQPEERARFRRTVQDLDCTWISNEAPAVFPDITAQRPEGTASEGHFVLAVDGVPTALTSPHGRTYEAIPARS